MYASCPETCKCDSGEIHPDGMRSNFEGYCEYYCWNGKCHNKMESGIDCRSCSLGKIIL